MGGPTASSISFILAETNISEHLGPSDCPFLPHLNWKTVKIGSVYRRVFSTAKTYNILHQTNEFHEATPQLGALVPYLCDVLFVHLFQRLEGVPRVRAPPQRALVADAAPAGPAVHAELLVVADASNGKKPMLLEDFLCKTISTTK